MNEVEAIANLKQAKHMKAVLYMYAFCFAVYIHVPVLVNRFLFHYR